MCKYTQVVKNLTNFYYCYSGSDQALTNESFLFQAGCDLYKQVQLDTGQRSLSSNYAPNNIMQQIQQVSS